MLQKILDLHIHSKYSRACSKDLDLPKIAEACEQRGIDIVVTGDFTHPKWFEYIRENLVEVREGVYTLTPLQPSPGRGGSKTRFILGTEIACIKKHKGKTRRVHVLVFAPNIEVVEKFNRRLEVDGFNLRSDGRPIIGLTPKELLQVMLEVDDRMVMVPAHVWTPWFGILGSKGGYDCLEEAFDELTPCIPAIETGLSSDPLMNARCSFLDSVTLISNSDAHSPAKLGREANVMTFTSEESITYATIMSGLNKKTSAIDYTIEFYPEEGKYHLDGHAACSVVLSPEDTTKYHGICPVCKKPLVIGVLNRVVQLGDRTNEEAKQYVSRFKSIVPLPEIIADVFQVGVGSKKVQTAYRELLRKLGNEFYVVLEAPLEDVENVSSTVLARAIEKMRQGDIDIHPGYDGVFGVVKIFTDEELRGLLE